MSKTYTPPPTIKLFMEDVLNNQALFDKSGEKLLQGHFAWWLRGPIGSGKTSGICLLMSIIAELQKPNYAGKRKTKFLIVRKSYKNIEESILYTMQDWIPGLKIKRGNRPSAYLNRKLEDGTSVNAQFIFYAMDRAEEAEDLRSTEFTMMWVPEATEVPEEVGEIGAGRVGRFPSPADGGATYSGVIYDSNGPVNDSYLVKKFETQRTPGFATFRQPPALTYELDPNGEYFYEGKRCTFKGNPDAENIEHLKNGFAYYFKQLGHSDDMIRRNIFGENGIRYDGKGVYTSEFVDHMHIHDGVIIPEPATTLLIGMDWGFNPACVFGFVDHEGVRICDDLSAADVPLSEFVEDYIMPKLISEYTHWHNNNQILFIGDPAGRNRESNRGSKGIAELQDYGFHVTIAPFQDIERRVNPVKQILKQSRITDGRNEPRFLVSTSAVEVIEGFQGKYYFEKKRGTDTYRDKPCKDHPHSDIMNALEYMVSWVKYGGDPEMYRNNYHATSGAPGKRKKFNFG